MEVLEAKVGLHRSALSRFVPLTLHHTITTTCRELARLGGPDVLAASLQILQDEVLIPTDAELVGAYGGHSHVSRAAAQAYDTSGRVTDADGAAAPPLWLCGHFVAKPFALMLDELLGEARGQSALLWQTKSHVQPRGEEDEWARMRELGGAVKRWADDGAAESTLRPGRVDTAGGSAADYRGLMTRLGADDE